MNRIKQGSKKAVEVKFGIFILISVLLLTLRHNPIASQSRVTAAQEEYVKLQFESHGSLPGEDSYGFTAQNVCMACMWIAIHFDSRPPDLNYTEGSTGNYVVWDPSDFTNYTLNFNQEVIRGWSSSGRVNVTRGKIIVNVDGLPPGTYWVRLTIIRDPKYGCPSYCCQNTCFSYSHVTDTVGVTVIPKPGFLIPGFGLFEWLLTMGGVIGVVGVVSWYKYGRRTKDRAK